jgi:UDP-N-acetyl-D-mannosaminuronic acid transferase (WecB/TagA/CpsF family)
MALSWWWQLFVEPHQVWLLVAIVVLLLVVQRQELRDQHRVVHSA